MKTPFRRHYKFSAAREQGVALIMTLTILTIITILGLTAMRAGLLHVAIGTNAQVSMLTFQAAEDGFAALETTIAAQAATNPVGPISPGGVLSIAPGFERIACLRKTGLAVPTTLTGQVFCDPDPVDDGDPDTDADDDYMSERNAVMVQVAIMNPSDTSATPSMPGATGTDDSALPGGGSMLVRTVTTSVLPNFGSASKAEIKTCLQTKPNDDSADPTVETVTDCLADAGATYTTLVQDYSYRVSP